MLVFSQYIETRYTARLLESGAGGVGYLLKDRVGNVGEFVSALERVASGGTALDPEVIGTLLRRPDRASRFTLEEVAAGFTVEEVLSLTGMAVDVADPVGVMQDNWI